MTTDMYNSNLNQLEMRADWNNGSQKLSNHSQESNAFDTVEVVFKNLEDRLIQEILKFKQGIIFGCVAWLTSRPILKTLSECDNVQIIVQKEDFLKPDIGYTSNWKSELIKLYGALKCDIDRVQFRGNAGRTSYFSDPSSEPVRCVGNYNRLKSPAFPRMHNKFLIFCELVGDVNDFNFGYNPISVWTGSFNFTQNASRSFENALLLTDKSGTNKVLNAYLEEHHQIFCLSEQLNWEVDWVAPEYRLGS